MWEKWVDIFAISQKQQSTSGPAEPLHRSEARSSLLFRRCNCVQLHYHFFIDPSHYSSQRSILQEINKLASFTKFGGPTQLERWFALTFATRICVCCFLSADLLALLIHKAKSKSTTGVNVIETKFNNWMGINKRKKEKTEKYHHYHIIITVKLLKEHVLGSVQSEDRSRDMTHK